MRSTPFLAACTPVTATRSTLIPAQCPAHGRPRVLARPVTGMQPTGWKVTATHPEKAVAMPTTSLPRLAVVASLVAALAASGDPASAAYPGENGRLSFALSIDGKLIAYCGQESGFLEIWTMTKNGHDKRQLTHVNGRTTFPDFSPDDSH